MGIERASMFEEGQQMKIDKSSHGTNGMGSLVPPHGGKLLPLLVGANER